MNIKKFSSLPSRREFLLNILPAGTLLCLGCTSLLASPQEEKESKSPSGKHKFLEDSKMSFMDVYGFTFQGNFIPVMQILANEIGKEKFVEMLKKASSEAAAQNIKRQTQNIPKKDFPTFLTTFYEPMKKSYFWKHVLTYEDIEKTEKTFEVKISECLWAKTFRDAKASDIGYASICYPDYAMASAFNPKIKMIRSKTLMQGHDCCNHRYVWEG